MAIRDEAALRAMLARGDSHIVGTPPGRPLDAGAPEEEVQGLVQQLCTDLGLLYFHLVGKAAKTSSPGLPDALILDPEALAPTLFTLELKRTGEQPSPAQRRWLEAFARVQRVHAGTYYPKDWELIQQLLTRRA